MNTKLTFLFDGECPLCLKETNFLKKKDIYKQILFVDISSEYNPSQFNNISYKEAMKNLHGIINNGEIILGVDVLAYAYELVGIGWLYYPVKIPLISQLIKLVYKYWAKYRLNLTGRKNVQNICDSGCKDKI